MKTKHSGLSFVQGRHTNASLAPNGREKIATYPKPVFHRILNFVGAEKAASNLRNLPEYKTAKTMFCNPDSPQRPVREIALKDGKTVVMATPRLREGFPILDRHKMPSNRMSEASTIHGAFKYGRAVKPNETKIDLFVAGCPNQSNCYANSNHSRS